MGLFKRVGDVISANLNDLVQQCENPEKMLRQAVREMEAALGRLMDGAARAIAHERLLARQIEYEHGRVGRHFQAADAAVRRGDDEAARRSLHHKLRHELLAESLGEQLASAAALGEKLRGQVAAMRLKLAETRRKLVDLTARSRAAEARRKFAATARVGQGCGAALSTFERISSSVEQTEAETDALFDLLGEADERDAPDDAFEDRVQVELAALKEKLH